MTYHGILKDLAEKISQLSETDFHKFYGVLCTDETIQPRRQDYEDDIEYAFACELLRAHRHVGRAAYILRKKIMN